MYFTFFIGTFSQEKWSPTNPVRFTLNEENLLNGFSGEVFKSNGITSDWYDEEKNERNRHKNVEENYIPSNLKANPRFFKFIFFPLHQKLVCEVKDPENEIQIGLLEKFLKK